jgi:hypothetical protein
MEAARDGWSLAAGHDGEYRDVAFGEIESGLVAG